MSTWWKQLWVFMIPLFVLDKACLHMWFPAKWIVLTPARILYSPITLLLYIGSGGIWGFFASVWYTLSGEGEWGDNI